MHRSAQGECGTGGPSDDLPPDLPTKTLPSGNSFERYRFTSLGLKHGTAENQIKKRLRCLCGHFEITHVVQVEFQSSP